MLLSRRLVLEEQTSSETLAVAFCVFYCFIEWVVGIFDCTQVRLAFSFLQACTQTFRHLKK